MMAMNSTMIALLHTQSQLCNKQAARLSFRQILQLYLCID